MLHTEQPQTWQGPAGWAQADTFSCPARSCCLRAGALELSSWVLWEQHGCVSS